jgi:hypothetical protein
MPIMKVMDLGKVNVTRLPGRIPRTITAPNGRRVDIDRETFLLLWAIRHMNELEKLRVLSKLESEHSSHAIEFEDDSLPQARHMHPILGFIERLEHLRRF